MFRNMRNSQTSGTVQRALDVLRRRLPQGWAATESKTRKGSTLRLRATDGRRAELAVILRKGVVPRDVAALAAASTKPALVVAGYLGSRTRELLAEAGISYIDTTGNLRVVVSDPAVFLEASGADKDPERIQRPLYSLRGAGAARVVRALCEFTPPFGVRQLAELAVTPLGTTSRVISLLETEALIRRDEKKRVTEVDWAALLERWSNDYDLSSSNTVTSYLAPRGLDALWSKVATLPRYAATGSVAGTGLAPSRLAMVYVDEPDAAAERIGLIETEAGANVWLLQPYDGVVFERTRRRMLESTQQEVEVVSPAQAYVDLASSPGRGPREAEALLERMRSTVKEWRRAARS